MIKKSTTAEIQKHHDYLVAHPEFFDCDEIDEAHKDRGILLDRLEAADKNLKSCHKAGGREIILRMKAEATINSISENPDFGSCMSVIKQRNEQIYDLEATIRAIGGLKKYAADSLFITHNLPDNSPVILWDELQALLKENKDD